MISYEERDPTEMRTRDLVSGHVISARAGHAIVNRTWLNGRLATDGMPLMVIAVDFSGGADHITSGQDRKWTVVGVDRSRAAWERDRAAGRT